MLFPTANLRESTMASSKKLISTMTGNRKINQSINQAYNILLVTRQSRHSRHNASLKETNCKRRHRRFA